MKKKYTTDEERRLAKKERNDRYRANRSPEAHARDKANTQRHNQARRAADAAAENERIAVLKRRKREAAGPQPEGYVYEPGRPGRKPTKGRTTPPKTASHRPANPERSVALTRFREAKADYDLAVANYRAAAASMPEARRRHLQATLLQRRAELVRMHAELTRGG